MKKIKFIVLSIFFTNIPLISQESKQKGLVMYNYIFYIDTIRLAGNESESFLYFDVDKQQSVYIWYRKSPRKSKEFVKLNDGSSYMKVKNGGVDPIGNIVFKDYKKDNIVERVLGDNVKIVSDSFRINWQISEDTKVINEMVLQKAECDFRGRHYIAWFNSKIPISDGPWKLRGLPGLIIEAYDEKKHVQFNFTSLTLPADFTQHIEAPSDGTPIVFDCVKFAEAHYKRVRELRNAQISKVEQMGGSVQRGVDNKPNILERCY